MPVHCKHYLNSLIMPFEEDLLKDFHDKFHGRVMVIEQNHPIPRRKLCFIRVFDCGMGCCCIPDACHGWDIPLRKKPGRINCPHGPYHPALIISYHTATHRPVWQTCI